LRDSAKKALRLLTTDEGYFIRSLDPDGKRHGVFGAPQHGYFEASPNHDAIALRVADDAQAEKIFRKIASLPELRPHDFVLPNYPAYDDMYEKPTSIWAYGTWVNGGHWSTCEARVILAYYRLGKFDDARRSMRRLLTFAERFRMDNPLTKCGSDVYQPNQPVNLTYDAFGPPAAFLRGLFEYLYSADGLTLVPHVPPSITELEQLDPVRFGRKNIFLSVAGDGAITAVQVNGRNWKSFDSASVYLPYARMPELACVKVFRGGAKPSVRKSSRPSLAPTREDAQWREPASAARFDKSVERIREFHHRLATARLGETYEAAHAKLILDCAQVVAVRLKLLDAGKIHRLPEPSQIAADKSYVETVTKLCNGFESVLQSYERSSDRTRRRMFELWRETRNGL